MTELERLQEEAHANAAWRGHSLVWRNDIRGRQATGTYNCGLSATVNTRPAPNGIDIGGPAVAMNHDMGGDTMTDRDESIRGLASEAFSSMERATREDGTKYTRKRDDAPEWVASIVYAAHGGLFLPDDWRYETIREAFGHIADSTGHTDDLDETTAEFADAADVYNDDLIRWVGSNQNRAAYVDEARAEFGEPRDFYHSLQMGQYLERAEVYAAVLNGLRNVEEASE